MTGSVDLADDPLNDRTILNFTGTGSGSGTGSGVGYTTVQDQLGTPQTARQTLEFLGYPTVKDDAAGKRTQVSYPTTTFVYQPGGTAGGNVFTSYAAADAAVHAASLLGYKVKLVFDATYNGGNGVNIPFGTYLGGEGVTWEGIAAQSGGQGTFVTCDAGTTLGILPERFVWIAPELTGPIGSPVNNTNTGVWTVTSSRSVEFHHCFVNSDQTTMSGCSICVTSPGAPGVKTTLQVSMSEDSETLDSTTDLLFVFAAPYSTASIVLDGGSAIGKNTVGCYGSGLRASVGLVEIFVNSEAAGANATQTNARGAFSIVYPPVQGGQLEIPWLAAITEVFSTASTVVASRSFDPTIYAATTPAGLSARQFTFVADVYVPSGVTSAAIEMTDTSDAQLTGSALSAASVGWQTVSGVIPSNQFTAGPAVYLVQATKIGGTTDQAVLVGNARIRVDYD